MPQNKTDTVDESIPQPSPAGQRQSLDDGASQPEDDRDDDAGSPKPTNDKMKSRMEKLAQLRKKIDESQRANRQDVYAEHQKLKENPREAARLERKRGQAEQLLDKKTAEEQGLDYERKEALKYSVEDVERWEKRQQEKAARADTGITDFGQMAAKKYNKQIKELKPNLALYEEQKSLAAVASAISSNRDESDFYRDANSMAYANLDNRPDAEAVDRLVQSVNEESKFSRRRTQRDDDDVNFINDRNKRFNKKISRAFDKYTADIKSSFERGTALD